MATKRLFSALVGLLLLAGCATTRPPTITPSSELGRSEHVLVAYAREGDTLASIAKRYLGDSELSDRVQPLRGPLRAGAPVAVAMTKEDGALASPPRYVPILCYHRFTSGRSTSRMEVTAASFDEQLRWLRDNGWTVVPFKALDAFLNNRGELPAKAVVITVDDGYRSLYTVALPILKRYGDPATAFVYTDFVGGGAALTWPQIGELVRSGLVDVQSHSKSHHDLVKHLAGETPSAYERRLTTEVRTPMELLSEHGARAPVVYAYPYGSADVAVQNAVRRAGYALGATVARGGNPSWAPPYLLRRDMVFGDDPLSVFAARVRSAAEGGAGASEAEEP